MVILDTGGLLAALDSDQRLHRASKEALERASGPLLLSPFVLIELDYLLTTRVGREAELAMLNEVVRGTYRLEPFATTDVAEATRVIERYSGFGDLGLADASIVVLANRHDVSDVLTFDQRHFRVVTGPRGRPFRLLPADSQLSVAQRAPRREFMYVDDLADACLFLMENYSGSEIVNVGVGRDISIGELAKLIGGVVGYEGAIVYDASRPDGVPRKLLDVGRLHGLGWEASTPLQSGIRQTYEWFLKSKHHSTEVQRPTQQGVNR